MRLAAATGGEDLSRSAARADGDARERIADAEPSVFRPVLAFEQRIARAAGAHEARADGGDADALRGELSAQAFGEAHKSKLAGAIRK